VIKLNAIIAIVLSRRLAGFEPETTPENAKAQESPFLVRV